MTTMTTTLVVEQIHTILYLPADRALETVKSLAARLKGAPTNVQWTSEDMETFLSAMARAGA
jgi:hypothetical protein